MVIVMLSNPGTVENRVYRAYWNDGLLDVFAAVGVLTIGACWMLDFVVGGAITPALLIPLWGPVRQRFVEPRLGMVEFSDERERRNRNRLWMVILLGVGSFAFAIGFSVLRDRLALAPAVSLIAGLPAILLAVLAALAALLVSTGRFLVYAALLAGTGVLGAARGWEPGPILVSAGLIILVLALAVLIRFLRHNPVETEVSP